MSATFVAYTTQEEAQGALQQSETVSGTQGPPEEPGESTYSPENITARATTVTLVLEEIFAQRGVPHGGLND